MSTIMDEEENPVDVGDAAYVVFNELSAELKMHLDRLEQVLNTDLNTQPLSGKIDLEKK